MLSILLAAAALADMPLVPLRLVAPTVEQRIAYAGSGNFLGRPADGYEAAECYLLPPAAEALAKVQASLEAQNQTLVVFDCYRPARAVADFMGWTKSPDETTKAGFYPRVEKRNLVAEGYIAEVSGHSRGLAVDLTIAVKGAPEASHGGPCASPAAPGLNMGTGFDCFDPASATEGPLPGDVVAINRALLVEAMAAEGFKNYPGEWWHFSLIVEGEPPPIRDVPVTPVNAR